MKKPLLVALLLFLTPASFAQDGPQIKILLPETNATYGKYIPIQIEIQNFRLTDRWTLPGGEERPAVPKEGHVRYTLDNQTLASTTATALMLMDLPTAEHTLVITLVSSDHNVLPIEQRVIFNVLAPRKGLTRQPLVGAAAIYP
jgi:hypothetical protein